MSDDRPRQQAQVFGEVADLYHQHRAPYPVDLYEAIVHLVALGDQAQIADVGSGTGLSSAWFVDHGHHVHAIEPDPAMSAIADRELGPSGRHTKFAGTFDNWTPPVDGVDLVVSGQAWHWMDPHTRFDLAADALAPRRGALAVFWNRPEPESLPWYDDVQAVYDELVPLHGSVPVKIAFPGRKAAIAASTPTEEFDQSGRFEEVAEWSMQWHRELSTDDHLNQLMTQSDHRMLDPTVRTELLQRVGELIDRHGGRYRMPYLTHAYIARVAEG